MFLLVVVLVGCGSRAAAPPARTGHLMAYDAGRDRIVLAAGGAIGGGLHDTWRWTTSVGTLHRQLDHIEHDDRLVAVAGRVLPGGNSDHLAVVADFVVDVATQPAARLP